MGARGVRETGIEAGIPGCQGNKFNPTAIAGMQQLQQPQKQGLKLKKTGFVAFLQRFVVAACLLHREKCEKIV